MNQGRFSALDSIRTEKQAVPSYETPGQETIQA
jgi:hypothetical protein